MDSKKRKLILIVEDELTYHKILSEKFKYENYEIISALDGEDGLTMAIEKHPDLILLDLQMPKMGGLEMVEKLREDDWGKNAKIVILTNISDADKLRQAMSNNIFTYLIKDDIKISSVLEKVKEILN